MRPAQTERLATIPVASNALRSALTMAECLCAERLIGSILVDLCDEPLIDEAD
jgi:hypothetical protein